jgi:hypothetical protein
MPAIDINLSGDNAWPDLRDRRDDILEAADLWRLTAREGGMSSGAPSVGLRLDCGDKVVIAETSLAAWIAATCALRGKFPEAFAGTPLDGGG